MDGQYEARYLVGAGGTHCPVRAKFFPREKENRENGLIIAKEEEFLYPVSDPRCHLWFFEDGLPGYAWYCTQNGRLPQCWDRRCGCWAEKAGNKSRSALAAPDSQACGVEFGKKPRFHPLGYSYYLRRGTSPPAREHPPDRRFAGLATRDMGEGIGPAIQSGILAADSIASGSAYSLKSIPRFSLPSLLRLRK